MKTILAPVDFSGVTNAVVAEAAALARGVDGRVVLLTIIQPPSAVAASEPLLANLAEITAAGEKAAARKLAKLQDDLQNAFVRVDTAQLVGAPIPHIVAEAERVGADYIVMGSHGHSALYDLLVGSTTQGVLKRASCPVVIVPARTTLKRKVARNPAAGRAMAGR